MDDILASIRRILDDEDKAAKTSSDEVLVLDESMMVESAESAAAPPPQVEPAVAKPAVNVHTPPVTPDMPPAPAEEEPDFASLMAEAFKEPPPVFPSKPATPAAPPPAPAAAPPPPPPPAAVAPPAPPPPVSDDEDAPLVAPAAAAAAAASMGALMRTLATERAVPVHRGGLTIEDLVREELRPMLKAWLDAHLPPVVEKLVQAEIERVVGRMAG